MVVILGADHAGFSLKENIKGFLPGKVIDLSLEFRKDDDYPDVARAVVKEAKLKGAKAVLVCGSGIGMSIAANRYKGVRAALCHGPGDAVIARSDNDANVLCLGGRTTGTDSAKEIIEAFFKTPFAGRKRSGERHKRRVEKLG